MTTRMETGMAGETQAVRYLESRGWTILERNWRYRHKEIDIIARQGGLLAIIEVKVRGEIGRERLEEHIPPRKQQFLVTAADAYVRRHRLDLEVRFDIMLITGTGSAARLSHIRDAFRPGDIR